MIKFLYQKRVAENRREKIMFVKAIEILMNADNQEQAEEMAAALATQDGVTGARVIGGHSKPYSAQGFMALPEGVTQNELPEGWHIRMVPISLFA